MAQSSDRNDSDNNDESGSIQAEQKLDSNIEHFDSMEESASGDKPIDSETTQAEYSISDANLKSGATQQKQVLESGTVSDFKNIEKRASELASRLGGAGLSYSAGVKKHLEPSAESVTQEDQQDTPIIEATIHQDDMDVDSERFGVSDIEEPASEQIETDKNEIVQQEYHVSEWNAELKEEQSAEHAPSMDFVEPPVEQISDRPVAKSVDVQVNIAPLEIAPLEVAPLDVASDHSPDLQDIENNIEALSHSMKNQDEESVDLNMSDQSDQSDAVPALQNDSVELMDQRVSTLEKHIVQLLDDVAMSEQKMGDKVTDIVRTQTQEAVIDTIKVSNVFGEMKAELANAAEQRHRQDVRMSDSLDALHDALKDIGDRVKAIETSGAVVPQSAELDISGSGKILSSVLGSSLPERKRDAAKDHIKEEPPAPAIDIDDGSPSHGQKEIPAWLSDSTQDLHSDQLGDPLESADVFAPNSEPEKAVVVESPKDNGPVISKKTDNEHDVMETANVQASVVVEPEYQVENEPGDKEEIADVEVEMNDQSSVQVQNKGEAIEAQETLETNDFLRSARAAARAANERARASESEEEAGQKGSLMQKSSNFIAAAKQKETGVEPDPIGDKVTSKPKNSLFSDKAQGPNSLLVLTSLILFGTSALLLYGMSRSGIDSDAVVESNAVEKSVGQNPSGLAQGIESRIKGKSTINKKANKGIGGRSKLDTDFAVAMVDKFANNHQSDTLTDHDKTVTSQIEGMANEPSVIRYTGALNGSKQTIPVGSLFDQYSSFSTPSGTAGLVNGSAFKTKSDKTIPAEKVGAAVLLNSASKGDAQAQYEVARRYGKGIGVKKSPAISVEWYEKSAKAGYAPAIYRLATMYERGNGVAKDYKRAMKLYITAAKKGNVKAMHNLAVLYTGGNLGKADYSNAIFWYKKAAHYGVKDSQFNLAIIYQNGMGGSLDLEKAFKWYSLAARAGDEEAKSMVMDLRKELTGKQQKKLDNKLRNWRAKTPDKSTNAVSQFLKASL